MIEPRLARALLGRLRRAAMAAAVDQAVEADVLQASFAVVDGREVKTFAVGEAAMGRSAAGIVQLLARHSGQTIGRGSIGSGVRSLPSDLREALDAQNRDVQNREAEDRDGGRRNGRKPHREDGEGGHQDADGRNARGAGDAQPTEDSKVVQRDNAGSTGDSLAPWRVPELVRLVRSTAAPLKADEVATLMLLAQAFGISAPPFAVTRQRPGVANPIVSVIGMVRGFENAFRDLLSRGLILPGSVGLANGYQIGDRHRAIRFYYSEPPRWRVILLPGDDFDADRPGWTEDQVGMGAQSGYAMLGLAEDADSIPASLRRAAQLDLVSGPLDAEVIGLTIAAVTGEEPEGTIDDALAAHLTLADLALAIRPGLAVPRILTLLADLARMRRQSLEGNGEGQGSGKTGGKAGGKASAASALSSASWRGRDKSSGSEVIRPVKPTGDADADRFTLRVETLSGYGEATTWAMDLKADLALWNENRLGWSDLSAKLLLSGPPGTGKTTFARALCNSLDIPLIATSVATWLEPGYLGDVLKRMKLAFAEAEAERPSILFIDEFDAIGHRGMGGQHDDYWNTLVNRLLELLDGAARSTGVVVGATNNPGVIDKALLRSGRLERHIVIPKPDTEALIGILAHHLGADLEAVVANAPDPAAGGDEETGQEDPADLFAHGDGERAGDLEEAGRDDADTVPTPRAAAKTDADARAPSRHGDETAGAGTLTHRSVATARSLITPTRQTDRSTHPW